jgi:uncharacterized membrane protein
VRLGLDAVRYARPRYTKAGVTRFRLLAALFGVLSIIADIVAWATHNGRIETAGQLCFGFFFLTLFIALRKQRS